MLASSLLRAQGASLSKQLRAFGVPASMVDGWATEWALMTVDVDEESITPEEACLRQIRLLTSAQDLVKVYGL